MESVFAWISQYGYAALFILLVLGIVGLPVPDETLLVFCGYLIWKGRLQATGAFLAGFGGSACGISLSYLLGRKYGRRVIGRYGRYFGFTEERLARVERSFLRLGAWLLATGYFIPGVRHFTALVAGMAGLDLRRFALFAYAGAAIWVATFLSLGYFAGEKWQQTSALAHRYILFAAACAAVLILVGWLIRRSRRARVRSVEL